MAKNITGIEDKICQIVEDFSKEDFIYDFLLAFGFTKMQIKRLREGNSNLSKNPNQVIIKQKLFYKFNENNDIYSLIDDLKNDSKTYIHKPRFIIVTDSKRLLAIDTKTKESLDTVLDELYKYCEFFLPWTGKEKYVRHMENPADVRTAEKMAQIYDEIVGLNHDFVKNNRHALNVFFTRLLFCFFAEDTIFDGNNIFTEAVFNHTKDDGSDLKVFLEMLFEILDDKDKSRQEYPHFMWSFPYVNGNLFSERFEIPVFNKKARQLIIECGNEDYFESVYKYVDELTYACAKKIVLELFSENSRHMTVHKSKGKEYASVLVNLEPFGGRTSAEKDFQPAEIFTSLPSVTSGNSVYEEYLRIAYLACSRAINKLYIHLHGDENTVENIKNTLNNYYANEPDRQDFFDFVYC